MYIVKKGFEILAELDAQLAQAGKIPQVVYIFRAKNFHGMQDNVQVEVTTTPEKVPTAAELEAKYADAIEVKFDENEDAES